MVPIEEGWNDVFGIVFEFDVVGSRMLFYLLYLAKC
jgi:hypothetical protein